MKILGIIIAATGLIFGIGTIPAIWRFQKIFNDMGLELPSLTILVLNTKGLFPMAISTVSSIILLHAASTGSMKRLVPWMIITCVVGVISIGILTMALLGPLSQMISEMK